MAAGDITTLGHIFALGIVCVCVQRVCVCVCAPAMSVGSLMIWLVLRRVNVKAC